MAWILGEISLPVVCDKICVGPDDKQLNRAVDCAVSVNWSDRTKRFSHDGGGLLHSLAHNMIGPYTFLDEWGDDLP